MCPVFYDSSPSRAIRATHFVISRRSIRQNNRTFLDSTGFLYATYTRKNNEVHVPIVPTERHVHVKFKT